MLGKTDVAMFRGESHGLLPGFAAGGSPATRSIFG